MSMEIMMTYLSWDSKQGFDDKILTSLLNIRDVNFARQGCHRDVNATCKSFYVRKVTLLLSNVGYILPN